MHNAHAFGRWLEPDSVQSFRFHSARLRDKLHRDSTGPDPRELQDSPNLIFGSFVFGAGTAERFQAVPSGAEVNEPIEQRPSGGGGGVGG